MLSRKTYRAIVKSLEHLKAQNDADRKENPGRTPIDWKSAIERNIEYFARENRERCSRQQVQECLQSLVNSKHIVPYLTGYSFPGTALPTAEEVKANVEKLLAKLGPSKLDDPVWNAGYDAYHNGIARDGNPHVVGTKFFDKWQDGWDRADGDSDTD